MNDLRQFLIVPDFRYTEVAEPWRHDVFPGDDEKRRAFLPEA